MASLLIFVWPLVMRFIQDNFFSEKCTEEFWQNFKTSMKMKVNYTSRIAFSIELKNYTAIKFFLQQNVNVLHEKPQKSNIYKQCRYQYSIVMTCIDYRGRESVFSCSSNPYIYTKHYIMTLSIRIIIMHTGPGANWYIIELRAFCQ